MVSSSISNEIIKSIVTKHLNTEPDQITIRAEEEQELGQRYRIGSADNDFIVRFGPSKKRAKLFYEADLLSREVALISFLKEKTTIPLPEVVATDFSGEFLDREIAIFKPMSGNVYGEITSLSHAEHDRVYFQLGQYLQQMHTIIGDAFGHFVSPATWEPQPTWKAAFGLMWRDLLDDIVKCGVYSPDEAAAMVDLFERHGDYFERDEPPVLLHMDVRKENILVDRKGNVTGLLGLGFALWGDPEVEFTVLDCAGIWSSAFWKGYGTQRPNDAKSRIRRKFYFLYEVQRNIPIAVWHNHDFDEAEQYRQTCLTIADNLAPAGA